MAPAQPPPSGGRRRSRTVVILGGLAAGALLAATIGGATWWTLRDSSPGFAGADLTGVSLSVGARDVPENVILGQLLVLAFQAAGAEVDAKVGSGDLTSVRRDLVADRLDASVEYNGATWTYAMGLDDPPADPAELTKQVAELDGAEHGIVWLGRSPFNNAYGFAVGAALVKAHGGPFDLDSMAEYLRQQPDALVCQQPPGTVNANGLTRFEDATGFAIPDSQLVDRKPDKIASATASGECSFSEFATTSGELHQAGLSLVEAGDQLEINNASITLRDEVYEEQPEAFRTIAEALLSPLDDDTMRRLNARVTVDGEDPELVAREFLVAQGLLDG
ncbi:MAG: glycine betaine ABC transporter substrate-binding protein [Microthrixaceae bacterium]